MCIRDRGYTHHYDRTGDTGQTVRAEEFVAKKIGHDLARTRYTVDRPRRTQATDSLDAGLEDAALSPRTTWLSFQTVAANIRRSNEVAIREAECRPLPSEPMDQMAAACLLYTSRCV